MSVGFFNYYTVEDWTEEHSRRFAIQMSSLPDDRLRGKIKVFEGLNEPDVYGRPTLECHIKLLAIADRELERWAIQGE